MKKILTLLALIIIIAVGIGVYYMTPRAPDVVTVNDETAAAATTTPVGNQTQDNATSTVIGVSVEGRNITAYHFGTGSKELLFIGGIHGGYEWNTVLVAYQLMDYLEANPSVVPANVKVTVIPVLNPDGLNKVVGTAGRFTQANVSSSQEVQVAGRFNANTVDLNRNFDCDWQASGTWQTKTVSGGSAAFSEPESQAIKDYAGSKKPAAAVVWDGAAGGVFASNCHSGVSPETQTLTGKFAAASGYPAHESFDFYSITGDMVNWFAKENIPAISVLLTNHTDTEWTKNQAGIQALLTYYAE